MGRSGLGKGLGRADRHACGRYGPEMGSEHGRESAPDRN